ncbi:MAG TPA: type II toxin-antitoxin system VapC family toxin [Jiangellaceae bacterium]
MRLLDANVLVYAHREDAPRHAEYNGWLRAVLAGDEPFAVTSMVLTAFVRIVTHRRVFDPPSPLDSAFAFVDDVRSHDHCIMLEPAARHWQLFQAQCRKADARGNLVTDAHLAALAVETGSEIVTTDRDFARFADVRTAHPLA